MRRLLMVALVATVLYGCGGNNNQTSDNGKTNTDKTESASTTSSAAGGLKIVYVNIDTLQSQYNFAKRVRKDLKQKENEVRGDLGSREQNFRNQVASFQRTAGTMTMNNVEQTKKALASRQQELEAYGRVRQRELLNETNKMSKKLRENINDFFKRYAEKNNIDLILTKSAAGSSVLYGKNEMDVTMDIVKGLNKEYDEGKTGNIKTDEKKDSTKTDSTKK